MVQGETASTEKLQKLDKRVNRFKSTEGGGNEFSDQSASHDSREKQGSKYNSIGAMRNQLKLPGQISK